MTEYKIKRLPRLIKNLLLDIINYPLELQIIWLIEIVAYTTVLKEYSEETQVSLYYDDLAGDVAQLGFSSIFISILFEYRHAYVHTGHTSALPVLRKLLGYKDELDKLAESVDVKLSYNKTLYKVIEKIEV